MASFSRSIIFLSGGPAGSSSSSSAEYQPALMSISFSGSYPDQSLGYAGLIGSSVEADKSTRKMAQTARLVLSFRE